MSSSADRLNNKRLLKKMLSHAQFMVAIGAQIGVALRISLSASSSPTVGTSSYDELSDHALSKLGPRLLESCH